MSPLALLILVVWASQGMVDCGRMPTRQKNWGRGTQQQQGSYPRDNKQLPANTQLYPKNQYPNRNVPARRTTIIINGANPMGRPPTYGSGGYHPVYHPQPQVNYPNGMSMGGGGIYPQPYHQPNGGQYGVPNPYNPQPQGHFGTPGMGTGATIATGAVAGLAGGAVGGLGANLLKGYLNPSNHSQQQPPQSGATWPADSSLNSQPIDMTDPSGYPAPGQQPQGTAYPHAAGEGASLDPSYTTGSAAQAGSTVGQSQPTGSSS